MTGPLTPVETRAWAYIAQETLAGQPFPLSHQLAVAVGRHHHRAKVSDILYTLAHRALIQRSYRTGAGAGNGPRIAWTLSWAGLQLIERDQQIRLLSGAANGSASAPAGDSESSPSESPAPPKRRKPRVQKAREAPRKRSDRVVAARI